MITSLIVFASMYHFGMGIIILAFGPQNVANTLLFTELIPNAIFRASAYIFSALLPFLRMVWPNEWWTTATLWPQQLLLFLASASAMVLVYSGHYADGEIRSRIFIFTDQWVFIVVMVFHLRETVRL